MSRIMFQDRDQNEKIFQIIFVYLKERSNFKFLSEREQTTLNYLFFEKKTKVQIIQN